MTRYPRAFNFRRVPASPPRVVALPAATHVFQFTLDRRGFSVPAPWRDFLTFLGVARKDAPVSCLDSHSERIKRIAKDKGFMLEWSKRVPTWGDDEEVTITLTEEKPKQPRVSPKLAATFPWKMRKYLNQKP
jgi:hypothetical protein